MPMPLRRMAVPLALFLSGCFSALPLRTASAVEDDTWRLSGQLDLAPWCGFAQNLPERCTDLPEGIPLPQLRLDARRGVRPGADLGASLQLATQLAPGSRFDGAGVRFGASGSWHQELVDWPLEGERRRVLALAPTLSAAARTSGARGELAPEFEVALPLYFGHQLEAFELVGRVGLGERLTLTPSAADPLERLTARTEVLLGFGAFKRQPTGPGFWAGYEASAARPLDGRFLLSFGWFMDFAG